MNKETLITIVLVGLIFVGLLQLTQMRSFGFYPGGMCAYEQFDGAKGSCPEVMPDRYNSHIVSPQFKLNNRG